MTGQSVHLVLTMNSGSSSLKTGLYEIGSAETRVFSATLERIGGPASRMRITDTQGATVVDQPCQLPDHAAAIHTWLDWLHTQRPNLALDAVGHRVVHGGRDYYAAQPITPQLLANLRALIPLAPEHLPQALNLIAIMTEAYPDLPQIACFDTAFHRQMPRVAQQYALPRAFEADGVIRYGFHGLSYEYILSALRQVNADAAAGRVIIAHLGNGASMAAVRDGASMDTTMGFTPTGGLVMGTRSGDLDPGVLLYLLQEQYMTTADLNTLLNKQAGLLGVSGSSADMQELLEKETSDTRAAEAIALFCYQARKSVGALTAVLGGLDTLVFTGGIGEHAAPIRQRICDGLAFLGLHLDNARNAAHAPIISRDDSRIVVRVITTDEELIIAQHTRALI